MYLFVFDMAPTADSRQGVKSRGAGARTFRGLEGDWKAPRWMDNDEELRARSMDDELVAHATKYPYETNIAVRVARMERS